MYDKSHLSHQEMPKGLKSSLFLSASGDRNLVDGRADLAPPSVGKNSGEGSRRAVSREP